MSDQEHVVLFREGSDDGGTIDWVQAFCCCGWESEPAVAGAGLADEIGDHLYLEWLSNRVDPV
jgi:hypothetical protein